MTLVTLLQGRAAEPVPVPIPNPGPTPGTPLLTIVQQVCAVVGVAIPASVFNAINANRTMQEMLQLANEMAQRIAYDDREWTLLRKQQVYYGDGVTTAFYLPADYQRMLLTSNVWRSEQTQTPMRFIPDFDEWMQRRAQNYSDSRGEWTLTGGQMHIHPVLGNGVTARYGYLDKNCVALAGGGLSDHFLNDADTFRLNARLLKLGMIWQWKAQKGSPYAEDLGTYGDCFAMLMGYDSPSPIIIGRNPISFNARVAYPWPVPT
jgi:hypothetical protein